MNEIMKFMNEQNGINVLVRDSLKSMGEHMKLLGDTNLRLMNEVIELRKEIAILKLKLNERTSGLN